MADAEPEPNEEQGSSPASRGGAGAYIEGELGALYLLSMLAGIPAHGMPGARIASVRFQGTEQGYKLDDVILHGTSPSGDTLLEIQSKRDISFSPKDSVYADVAAQIARSGSDSVAEERHFLGIATQRTSRKISGAYQDVLKWAAKAESAKAFFDRLAAKGIANGDMREFVATSREHLVANGIEDSDEAIWRILKRTLILEFDFEASASFVRTHGLMLARQVLADDQIGQAEALWRTLIEISAETAATGGALDRVALMQKLGAMGYRLAGDRDYGPARAKLADMAENTLAGVGNSVAGVNLPRLELVAELDEALDAHRFVELRGGPGVGKSWLLSNAAERRARLGPVIVLDPVATPGGGWLAFAHALGIPGTAAAFLLDLATSGGATIFVDSIDMIADPERQRTVSELLRAASAIAGMSVILTGRAASEAEAGLWLNEDIVAAFGGAHTVQIGELSDAEVAVLVDQAPELAVLLDADHPAAPLARNLYRLSRLLKVPSATEIRTEAALAKLWWESADGARPQDVRAGQRILAELAGCALQGESGIELESDSDARRHLLGALTLKEVRRDRLDFYHEVLRDWAIGAYLYEDPARIAALDLTVPVSPRIARGIEFAARLALETSADCSGWIELLARLAPKGAHSSWRRQAMLAIVRSEAGLEMLEKCSGRLLDSGGTLFAELVTTIAAIETVATVDILKLPDGTPLDLPRSHRTNITGTAIWVLRWVLKHVDEIPLEALGAVVELIEIQLNLIKSVPPLARPAATMLYLWLRQLDVHEAEVTIPSGGSGGRVDSEMRRRMIEKLRMAALLLGEFAPDQLKVYLKEIGAENDHYKVKPIRQFSPVIAPVAPAEFAELILGSLVEKHERDRPSRHSPAMERSFTFADSDYMPPSPAQPPFLDLLEASPGEGLKLIRMLVAEALAHHVEGSDNEEDGITIVFDAGPRFFPWTDTYLWSRGQAREYSAASGLKALEAWSHARLDKGESVDAVLTDILGPEGSCAAYVAIAVDVLLSHFEVSREALVPFIASPELLALDQHRAIDDQLNGSDRFSLRDEPAGKFRLADLKARPSRRLTLQSVLTAYLADTPANNVLRERLGAAVAELDPYEAHSTWADPRLIGRNTANLLDLANWDEIGGGKLLYQSPPDEAVHLAQMEERRGTSVERSEIESRIHLATEGGEYATHETAKIAIDYTKGDLPDNSDTDVLRSRSTRLITTALLVARDGDDALLEAHLEWVREVIDIGLAEQADRRTGNNEDLRYNRPAIAALALIHLWLRGQSKADRDRIVGLSIRRDRILAPAFAAVLPRIIKVEPKLLKAAMRAAFASCIWRWKAYREDEEEQASFEAEQAARAQAQVTAEIGWLDGGEEPAWPEWPDERPILR